MAAISQASRDFINSLTTEQLENRCTLKVLISLIQQIANEHLTPGGAQVGHLREYDRIFQVTSKLPTSSDLCARYIGLSQDVALRLRVSSPFPSEKASWDRLNRFLDQPLEPGSSLELISKRIKWIDLVWQKYLELAPLPDQQLGEKVAKELADLAAQAKAAAPK